MAHIWVVLGLTLLSIVLGIIWYGPLFGKKFSWANEWPDFNTLSKEEQEKAKKEAMPYYWFQMVVSLVQIFTLAYLVDMLPGVPAIKVAFLLWLGFIMPIMAGNVIWSMKPSNKRLTILSIGLSYQLVLMLVAGYVLGM